MAFRTRRQARYQKLRNSGFLPFESRALSRVPFKICPYMRQLINDRQETVLEAKRAGAAKTQYENQIKGLYNKEKWLKRDRINRAVADPWRMLRDYEDRWRQKQPSYTSPWEAKYRRWKDFYSKLERTMEKQRGLA